jgi:hypothetical protein
LLKLIAEGVPKFGVVSAGDVRLSGAFNPFCPIVLIGIICSPALQSERLVRHSLLKVLGLL